MPSPFLEESTYVLQKHTRTFSGVNGTGQEGLSPVYYSGAAVVRVRLLYSLFFSRSVPRPFFFFLYVSSVRPRFVMDFPIFFLISLFLCTSMFFRVVCHP